MRRFRSIWCVLAALLWLPAVAHCPLELLTDLELLRCEAEASASHAPAGDCTECCAVEKAQYRLEPMRLTAPPPEWLPMFLAAIPSPQAAVPSEPGVLSLTAAPPDLPQRWPFITRTAPTVRAPSLAS